MYRPQQSSQQRLPFGRSVTRNESRSVAPSVVESRRSHTSPLGTVLRSMLSHIYYRSQACDEFPSWRELTIPQRCSWCSPNINVDVADSLTSLNFGCLEGVFLLGRVDFTSPLTGSKYRCIYLLARAWLAVEILFVRACLLLLCTADTQVRASECFRVLLFRFHVIPWRASGRENKAASLC